MSASSKKKLRNQEAAAKNTEKQLAAQKEEKKLKLYTAAFVAVLAVIVVIAGWVGISRAVANSGSAERSTVAVTIGDHKISNAELSYYYIDAINSFYSNYGSYIALTGLDPTKPLDEQVQDEETGTTWADYFIDLAKQNARTAYAVADEAAANGYVLSDASKNEVKQTLANMSAYAKVYGYSNGAGYLKALYGNGATEKTLQEYFERSLLVSEYYNFKQNGLVFSAEDMKAVEAEHPGEFDAFTYYQYYVSTTSFEGDNALAQAEEAAKSLTECATVEEFEAAVKALPFNADKEVSAAAYDGKLLSACNGLLKDWLADAARKEGDTTYVPSVYGEGDPTGYYAAFFVSRSDNQLPLVNVRHILVNYQGGTTEDGVTTYSDEEKAAAKAAAEELLAQWKAGEATDESFAALAHDNTDDPGSAENGGLYENVYPGQMVVNFNDWCFDSSRKPGDTGIVESNYGYHVMYFVGNAEQTYREHLIRSELETDTMNQWYSDLVEAVPVVDGAAKYLRTGLVLSGN